MKKILLLFGVLLILLFGFFLVQKNNFSQKNSNILQYNTGNLGICVFELYEKNAVLGNLQKQVGHATMMKDGLFVTNKHVIDLNKNYILSGNGLSFGVDKIWFEEDIDLAHLKGDKKIDCNLAIKSSSVNLGQKVFTQVYREGKNIKKTGNIIGLNENFEIDGIYYNNLTLTNLKLEHGDSGSPLFDFNGNIIGINTAISQKDSTTYSLLLD